MILPWWESETLKETPDMMPAPIEKIKKNRSRKKHLVLYKTLFQENPESRGKKPLAV